MTGLFKRKWTDEELDKKLDEFTSFTNDSMMPLEYARAVSRRYGASEQQVLAVVLRRVKNGQIRLVDGRIPVRQKGDDYIKALVGASANSDSNGWGVFRRLVRYYIDCVRAEGGCSFTLWGAQYGKNFSYLDRSGLWHPCRGTGQWSIFVGKDTAEFFEKLGNEDAGDLYLGYPIYVTTCQRKNRTNDVGEEDQGSELMLKPVFCWKLTRARQRGLEGWKVSLAEGQTDPEVNLMWLSKALKRADQKRAFLEECGLFDDGRTLLEDTESREEDDGEEPGAQSAVRLSNWDFRELASVVSAMFHERLAEPLVPERVMAGFALQEGAKAGYYNRAVLFTALPSPYTKRLLAELDFISKAEDAVLDRTALRHFFVQSPVAEASEGVQPNHCVCLADAIDMKGLEFTVAQRSAVASMLSNPVTVMQGPPGTGKSQAVAGVTVNERLRDQTVLVSALNHKAIDAVVERIDKLAHLLETEDKDAQEKCDSAIGSLVTRCNSKNKDEKDFGILQACDEIIRNPGTTIEQRKRIKAARRRREFDALLEERKILSAEADRLHGMAADMEEADAKRHDLETHTTWLLSVENPNISRAVDQKGILDAIQVLAESNGSVFRTCLARPVAAWRLMAWVKYLTTLFQESQSKNGSVVFPLLPKLSLLTRVDEKTVRQLQEVSKVIFARAGLLEQVEKLCRQLKEVPRSAMELTEDIRKVSSRLRESALELLLEDATARRRRAREGDGVQKIGNVRKILHDLLGIDGRRERYFSQEVYDGLQCVLEDRPVWAVSSLSVGKFIPPVPGLFDLVLVDEATQSNIPQAIPLLFRAKRAAVIGDPMQLQYISMMRPDRDFILRKRARVLDEGLRRFSYCENSLYDFAATAASHESCHIQLDITYRSCFAIAAYSSKYFYEGRLLVGTDEEKLKQRAPAGRFGLSWEETRGLVEPVPGGSCICRAEVEAVVNLVKSILVGTDFAGTIAVVSPFQRQAQLIDEEVTNRAGIPRERLKAVEFISSTAHSLQGDERDVIIFSLCSNDSMPQGCLNFVAKDPNIFNVAVSRARASLIVVGDRDWAKTCGIKHIEGLTLDWDRYAEPHETEWAPYESPYEKRLGEKLLESGLAVRPQVRVGVRRLDLALQEGAAKLDIEVDSDAWHRDESGHRRLEDTWRDEELARFGWRTLRIWTFEIDMDIEGCVKQVMHEWTTLRKKVKNKTEA